MEFSGQQQRALSAVHSWLESSPTDPFYLAGYAGTGKTTLAKHFASNVSGKVFFAAYTGKAAHVLENAGCEGARTIHSLIYLVAGKNFRGYEKLQEQLDSLLVLPEPTDQDLIQISQLQRELEQENENLKSPAFHLNLDSELNGASLLVVDECSMIDKRMGEDILSFEVPVLVLGDPGQLPPIRGQGYFTGRKPDFLLTDIHRQAKDNPIIRIADLIRKGEEIPYGEYGNSRVIEHIKLEEAVTNHEQVLVGKNTTRRFVNLKARELLLGALDLKPLPKDKLVCLRNNANLGLLNGSLWEVEEVLLYSGHKHRLRIRSNGDVLDVDALTAFFEGTEDQLQYWQMADGQKFDYGYALTVHKAQGSQWGSVLVRDESDAFRRSKKEWLYTAVTRASERVTIVRKP